MLPSGTSWGEMALEEQRQRREGRSPSQPLGNWVISILRPRLRQSRGPTNMGNWTREQMRPGITREVTFGYRVLKCSCLLVSQNDSLLPSSAAHAPRVHRCPTDLGGTAGTRGSIKSQVAFQPNDFSYQFPKEARRFWPFLQACFCLRFSVSCWRSTSPAARQDSAPRSWSKDSAPHEGRAEPSSHSHRLGWAVRPTQR